MGYALSPEDVDYFVADVVSARDFYPFGMGMPGRRFEIGEYRYGFNGQEFDSEWLGEGNAVSFKYRVHDARLGRFLSVDPLAPDYPWNSTYAFAENRVIESIDLEGMEAANATGNEDADSGPAKHFVTETVEITAISPSAQRGDLTIIGKARSPEGIVDAGTHGQRITFKSNLIYAKTPIYLDQNTLVYHKGNEYFPSGWYPEDQWPYLNLDYSGGQMLPPRSFWERIWASENTLGRDFEGMQVDEDGYLTGYESVHFQEGAGLLDYIGPGGGAKMFLRSLVKSDPTMLRYAKETFKNSENLSKETNAMMAQMRNGNLSPGIGSKGIGNGIHEARSQNGVRVYFRCNGNTIDILGYSHKGNQAAVINHLRKKFKKR